MQNRLNSIGRGLLAALSIFMLASCKGAFPERELDSLFTETFPSDGPGALVLFVKDGKIVYDKGFGVADIETGAPLTDSTMFNICSVSKQFSSVALMLLQERGLLSLDDPLRKFFPAFRSDFYNRITLRHILSHTSGLPDSRPRTQREWEVYTSKYPTAFATLEEYKLFCEEDESCRYLEGLDSLAFEPGTAYEYQNPTYQLALMIVEQVTGQDFDSWMRENVFLPAGMTRSLYFEPGARIENLSHGYSRDENGQWKEDDYGECNFFGTKADGGLYTTPLEFVKWDQALYGDKVMTEGSRKEVHTPRIPTDIPDTYYGYGWFIERRPDRPEKIYHTGDNGGYLIFEGRFPEKDLFYLIFANEPHWDREGVVEKVDQILSRSGLL